MRAKLLLHERHVISEDAFVELVIWQLSSPLDGSQHGFKYRLALIFKGECILRYDNERGQGDHKHRRSKRIPYEFTDPEALINDFWKDVKTWRS